MSWTLELKAFLKEITADPCSDSDEPLSTIRSSITIPTAVPRVECGFSPDSLFSQRTKSQLYELMLDRILTPRGLAGIEYNNHFVRIHWSTEPIDSAFPHFKPRCLLAALTSNFQLKLYDTKERQEYSDAKHLRKKKNKAATPNSNGRQRETDDSDEEQLDEDDVSYHDGWIPIFDLTKMYNQILLKEWAAEGEFQHCRFSSYKDRLYQLAIVDFGWINGWPVVDENEVLNLRAFNLITFHANGDLVIWWITIQPDRSLKAEVAYRTTLLKNQIVSAHKFVHVSADLGILAVGYNSGVVKVYRIKRKNTSSTSSAPGPTEYSMEVEDEGGSATLWSDTDRLQIKFLDFVVLPDENAGDRGQAPIVTLVVIKHPQHIFSFKVHVLPEQIIWEETSHLESSDGHIVSLSKHSTGIFMMNHENGKLGFLEIDNSCAYYISESSTWLDAEEETEENANLNAALDGEGGGGDDDNVDETKGDYLDSHKIHSKDPAYAGLWIFHGFALSPNGTLALSSKALRKTHDTILIKEASSCTFLSIFPSEDAWPCVKEKFEQNNFAIQSITDVLHGFRYQLRMTRDYELAKYRGAKTLNEMSISELKLYLWTIKAMGVPKQWDLTPKSFISGEDITQITTNLLRETALTQEAIVEKHLTKVMEQVFSQDPDDDNNPFMKSTKNLQSASAILQYLRSKPLSNIPSDFQVPAQPAPPICSSCDQEISFEYNKDYDPLKGISEPGIPGCKWNGQTCFDQHPNAVCILSLIPFDYPNRVCPYCGCAALMKPAFDQDPLCPFCEEFLRSYPEEEDEDEEGEEEEEVEEEEEEEEGEEPDERDISMEVDSDSDLSIEADIAP